MSGATLARRRSDESDRCRCSATGCWARRRGLLPALAALALEIELSATLARSSTGVPATAVYRRYMVAIAMAVAVPRKSDG